MSKFKIHILQVKFKLKSEANNVACFSLFIQNRKQASWPLAQRYKTPMDTGVREWIGRSVHHRTEVAVFRHSGDLTSVCPWQRTLSHTQSFSKNHHQIWWGSQPQKDYQSTETKAQSPVFTELIVCSFQPFKWESNQFSFWGKSHCCLTECQSSVYHGIDTGRRTSDIWFPGSLKEHFLFID